MKKNTKLKNKSKILSNKIKMDELNKIIKKAINDTQIDTTGIFDNFTDFQNIMFSDMSLIELLWEGNELDLQAKTIGELYIENLNVISKEIEYEKIVFDGNTMLEMSQKENWDKYRFLVLGKLVRYGFNDIKIVEKISGKEGFDAFILEDNKKDIMIYFPCTNLVEIEDYLYDSYPIMESLSKKIGFVGNLIKARKIYNSQQNQAKDLLEKYIINITSDKKIHVSGFSLGGSLAECSYLNSYKEYSKKLGNIILFNPYHNRLTEDEVNILKLSNKLKLYVCEGDSVSTIFNYENFEDIASVVYIDYHNNILNTINKINRQESLLNLVVNTLKNKYCDNIISICNKAKKNPIINTSMYFILKSSSKKLKKLKNHKLEATTFIKKIDDIVNKISPKLKKYGYNLSEDFNLEFLENLHFIEIIFTSTHLVYTVDSNKKISFNDKGKIINKLKLNDKEYKIQYPSFDETSTELFGANPYKEVSNIINKFEKNEK